MSTLIYVKWNLAIQESQVGVNFSELASIPGTKLMYPVWQLGRDSTETIDPGDLLNFTTSPNNGFDYGKRSIASVSDTEPADYRNSSGDIATTKIGTTDVAIYQTYTVSDADLAALRENLTPAQNNLSPVVNAPPPSGGGTRSGSQENPPPAPSDDDDRFVLSSGGGSTSSQGDVYDGPVDYLQRQFISSDADDIVTGTSLNDFINSRGGTDAIDAGAGNDVLDGGTGSNFLTGGAGVDTFFTDARIPGLTTWSTITDFDPATEEATIWGWRPGVSQGSWVASDGATGFEGATFHADVDGDGTTDTSVTFSGLTQYEIQEPLELNDLLWFM